MNGLQASHMQVNTKLQHVKEAAISKTSGGRESREEHPKGFSCGSALEIDVPHPAACPQGFLLGVIPQKKGKAHADAALGCTAGFSPLLGELFLCYLIICNYLLE